MKTLIVLAIAFCIVLICFAGIGIKMLLRRNGEFKRHCAGHDPYTGASNGCACAIHNHHQCATSKAHPYQPLDVNEELLKEMGK